MTITHDTDAYEVVLAGAHRKNCGTYTKIGRKSALNLANMWVDSGFGRRAIVTRLAGEPEIIEAVEA